MGVRRDVVAIAALTVGLLGLGRAAADPAPNGVVLTISRVQVKPRRVDGSTWDLPADRRSSSCGPVAAIGKVAWGPAGGLVASVLCSHAPLGRRDPSAPDLFVQVVAGDARYRTLVALDTFAEAFDFPVVVPLAGIPPTGLEIQVLDQDDTIGAGELIGMVRVTRKLLLDALASEAPLLTMSDSQLERIEIEVVPYPPPSTARSMVFEVNRSVTAMPIRPRAGELVTIAARGEYGVASNRTEIIDEHGYVGGQKRGYNLPEFKDANHGAAVALIGASNESHAALVVRSCVTTVSSVTGQIFVGVNDRDLGNNRGSLTFAVRVGLPTVEQWRSGGAFECQVHGVR